MIRLNAVVLPAPLGPIRPTSSPTFDVQREVGHGAQPAEVARDVIDM